jgi:serine/threonine protein kinase/tetratricopeptide (TPR) repeat protein
MAMSTTEILSVPVEDLAPGVTFADRYQVIEELGRGGMGKVYKVFDTQIKETVSLKLIKHEIAVEEKTIQRFQNEIRLARKISHKHICRLYHLGKEGGTHYITMEYVPGQDLKRLLKMNEWLNVETVLRWARQICDGLIEAHEQGIIHRDLKSSNVMVDREGNVRIMDFGLARNLRDEELTQVRGIIGTPEYMSPEQVEAKEIDHRSDIYSLGVILYELATGQVPFKGDTALHTAVKHKTETPPRPTQWNGAVPERLSRIILKCLEKDKRNRYQTVKDLRTALDQVQEEVSTQTVSSFPEPLILRGPPSRIHFRWPWLVVFILIAASLTLRLFFWDFQGAVAAPHTANTMLVVLPFENLGPPEDEYFADGLTEEITSRLSILHGLNVISRVSAKLYKNSEMTSKQIGEELGVDYVLEGTVRWDRGQDDSGRVRVTQELIRVVDDTHIWAESYDRVIDDIFAVQGEIAESVAVQLDLTVLEPEREALKHRHTQNLQAYNNYYKAVKHADAGWNNADGEEFEEAIRLLNLAVELDPGFMAAYTTLAETHLWSYNLGIDPSDERLDMARQAVAQVQELAGGSPEAEEAEALYLYWGERDYDRALEIFKQVQRSRPNRPYSYVGYIERLLGHWEEAHTFMQEAFRLDPRNCDLAYEISRNHICFGEYDRARQWLETSLEINPNYYYAQLWQALLPLVAEGDIERTEALVTALPDNRLTAYFHFQIAMMERNYQEALTILENSEFEAFRSRFFYIPKNLAIATVYFALQEEDLMNFHLDAARIVLEQNLERFPRDPRLHAALGRVFAFQGEREAALRQGEIAMQRRQVERDAFDGPRYVLDMAQICMILGEHEEALNRLEELVALPTRLLVTGPVLRIDPTWDPLRSLPRFQRVLEAADSRGRTVDRE